MPSENSANDDHVFETTWQKNTVNRAEEKEFKAFWKKLRQFYRTGKVKPTDSANGTIPAVSAVVNQLPGAYPYKVDDQPCDYHKDTPFILLKDALWKHQRSNKNQFKTKLNDLIAQLSDALAIEKEGDKIEKTYDFVSELIAFDKLTEVLSKKDVEEISHERSARLKEVFNDLKKGIDYFGDRTATIITNEKNKTTFKDYQHAEIIVVQTDILGQAKQVFDDRMKAFTDLIKAYRIATLEMEGNYVLETHQEYFEHFSWHQLSNDEMQLFHPIVIVTEQSYLFQNLGPFFSLMMTNVPIKVVVINEQLASEPNEGVNWEDATRRYREELVSMVLSFRKTFFLQSSLDEPDYVAKGLLKGLESPTPSVVHLLHAPKVDSNFLAGANASRMFPRLTYDPLSNDTWHQRFDSTSNIQDATTWPSYVLKVAAEQLEIPFTYADYKSLYQDKIKELMVVPGEFDSELLVSISNYLDLPEEQLYGKIPFIWIVNDKDELVKAAVPNVWVVSCLERLESWKFIKELSTEQKPVQVDVSPTDIPENIRVSEEELARIEEEAVAKAAERLITALLDDEDVAIEPMDGIAFDDEPKVEADVEVDGTPEEVLQSTGLSEQAWVESENCTSCNECTDKFSHIFQYNGDKQAFIPDPTKGTYEELVKAAEKCPAECIHPGAPQNKAEKNLEKLMKRAEKFN